MAATYPVVTVTGPRQSGKTTLCKAIFEGKRYVNLEGIAERNFASADPRSFLLRGALFETFAFAELLKARFNAAKNDKIFFYRDQRGLEIDFIMDYGTECEAIEVKSAKTLHPDFFSNLRAFSALHPAVRKSYLFYGGEESVDYLGATAIGWKRFASAALRT